MSSFTPLEPYFAGVLETLDTTMGADEARGILEKARTTND
jgi:hypothetical protein